MIEFWAVADNQESYLESGFLEFFRDFAGQFWAQNSLYLYPNASDPLHVTLPFKISPAPKYHSLFLLSSRHLHCPSSLIALHVALPASVLPPCACDAPKYHLPFRARDTPKYHLPFRARDTP
jgi:hypothetical protein